MTFAVLAGVVVLDAAALLAAGWILWSTAGETVVTGTFTGQCAFLAVLVVWSAARILYQRRVAERFPDAAGRGPAVIVVLHAAALAAAALTWLLTDDYFVGWLATLTALVLLVGSLLRFLTALAVPSAVTAKGVPAYRSPLVVAVGGLAVGALGMAFTAGVHDWNASIVGGVILLVGFALLAGFAVSVVVQRLVQAGRVEEGTAETAHP